MLNGVSKRLPTGVDLLKVYPDKVDLFIQDIDRNGQGQLDDEFQINIEGIWSLLIIQGLVFVGPAKQFLETIPLSTSIRYSRTTT